jgi:serine/threonine protein kinase
MAKLYQIQWFKCKTSTKSSTRCLTGLKQIGEGSYAKVFQAVDTQLKAKVAVKIFDKRQAVDKFKRNLIQKELDLLVKTEHPSIVEIYKVVEDRIRIYLIMEFWGRKTLKQHVIGLNETGGEYSIDT